MHDILLSFEVKITISFKTKPQWLQFCCIRGLIYFCWKQ